jgi:membrane protease YdiL (CAAX protease family)
MRCGTALDVETRACPRCSSVAPSPGRAAGEAGRRPTVGTALAVYFTLLGTFVFLVVDDGVVAEMAVGAVDAAIVVAWFAVFRRRLGPLLRPPERPLRWIGTAAALAGLTFAVAMVVVRGLGALFPGVEEIHYLEPFRDAGFSDGVAFLFVTVQPAIVEEMAMRGLVLEGLRGGLSDRDAVAVSATMFGILHCSIVSLPHLVLMGVLLAVLRLRSGSLWPCIVLHFAHNLLVLVSEAWAA